jgi:hypothetical protein
MPGKTIYYPPQGIDRQKVIIPVCLNYNDNTDTLTIVINDPGDFSDSNQKAFIKRIPTGHFETPITIGPCTPRQEKNYVELKLKDEATNLTYVYQVTIQSTPC